MRGEGSGIPQEETHPQGESASPEGEVAPPGSEPVLEEPALQSWGTIFTLPVGPSREAIKNEGPKLRRVPPTGSGVGLPFGRALWQQL